MLEPRLFPCGQDTYTSDDYYTPAWVFERMGIRFDLDVCAPPGGIPWIPADRYFTQEDDGLAQEWTGRVWMNPPFSNTAPWSRRFIEHGNGVALLPFARAHWFHDLWFAADAMAVPDTYSLFNFHHPISGTVNIYMPVHVAAFGEECVDAISRLGRVRR